MRQLPCLALDPLLLPFWLEFTRIGEYFCVCHQCVSLRNRSQISVQVRTTWQPRRSTGIPPYDWSWSRSCICLTPHTAQRGPTASTEGEDLEKKELFVAKDFPPSSRPFGGLLVRCRDALRRSCRRERSHARLHWKLLAGCCHGITLRVSRRSAGVQS